MEKSKEVAGIGWVGEGFRVPELAAQRGARIFSGARRGVRSGSRKRQLLNVDKAFISLLGDSSKFRIDSLAASLTPHIGITASTKICEVNDIGNSKWHLAR